MADLAATSAAVVVARCGPLEIVSLAARRGAAAALAARALERLGTSLPDGPQRCGAAGLSVLGVGPGRWLILRDGPDPTFEPELSAHLEGLAAVCLQTDAYAVFQVAGPKARATLAKGVAIDLHPLAFGLTSVAVTTAAHVGLILWQVSEEPAYQLAVPRSYAHGFWNWLCESAAEFGPPAQSARREVSEF